MFEKLPAPYQMVLKKVGAECLKELVAIIQSENLKAEKVLENNGVKWVPQPDPAEKKKFEQAGVMARENLSGKLFPPELLSSVLDYLNEVR